MSLAPTEPGIEERAKMAVKLVSEKLQVRSSR